jgi:hypothetical protein
MPKFRVEHEDIFITHVTNVDNMHAKHHFDFNHKWVASNSDTKRIAVRKRKVYTMNLTAEVAFAIDDSNSNQQRIEIHYTLIGN